MTGDTNVNSNGPPAGLHPTIDEPRAVSSGQPVVELNFAGAEPDSTFPLAF